MTAKAMTHEQARESLEALALDALPPDEQELVIAHASACAECREELASLRETVGALAHTIVAPPLAADRALAVRDRLVSRARADKLAAMPAGTRPARPARLSIAWGIAAGLLLAAGAALLVQNRARVRSLQDALDIERQRTRTQTATADSLRSALEAQSRLVAAITGADVAVVELTSAGARAPNARMFWDRTANAWTFVAHNMPALANGRTYQLWLVTTRSEKISAGTFRPSATGEAVVRATYALARDALAAVAVTEEPAGGVPQPTGSMVVSGAPK